MTRTARAQYPRAIARDRSIPKNARDKSFAKNGAGPHNWGDMSREHQHELFAMEDEDRELDEEGIVPSDTSSMLSETLEERAFSYQAGSNVTSNEDLETARRFRFKALKRRELDLSAIARTSSAAMIHPKTSVLPGQDARTLNVP
ncbi:putative expressed protein [Lyophyllum shimeji]|uniref:Expressed protein n=1 Tax=Lyophyllum shimeji TaxID=47721 RepID=A0A9P3ULT2_LYOSH|nr:putative expressed protein [Lyophyllum shimeji]